jgi:beta-fructofuranosidase
MKKIKSITLSIALFSLISCSQNEDSYTGGSISGGEAEITSIYPVPPSQWMGGTDPYYSAGYTGDIMPYFDNGTFHVYFLHDAQNKPAGKGFHDIHEYETTDLATFSYKGQMIPYGNTNEPDFAVGTGSVVKAGNLYYFYYTGHNETTPFIQNNPRESVLCATSTDLKNWTKVPNFKITAPAGYYDYDFRDPHVFYNEKDSNYNMIVSTQTEPGRKAVLLAFTSTDPSTGNWQVKGPIYTTTPEENFLMMECADIFKMGNYWYLLFSKNWGNSRGTHYRMASSIDGPWIKPENDRFDGEYFYAAKTASDGNKRYAFGWTARKLPENDGGNKEWAGNMVIHELTQGTDGKLGVKAPESVKNLFTENTAVTLDNKSGDVTVSNENYTLSGDAKAVFKSIGKKAKISGKFTLGNTTGSAGFMFYVDGTENYYKIAFEPSNNQIVGYNSQLRTETKIPFKFESSVSYNVEIVTEGSVCVLYIDGKAALSNRIYGRDKTNWGIFSDDQNFAVSNLEVKKVK